MNQDHDDELMKQISEAAPAFPPASREQIEQTWQAIVREIEAADATPEAVAPQEGTELAKPSWLDTIFPAAPAWSWQMAKVAALLAVGFGLAWFASGRGWLPGTSGPAVAVLPEGAPTESIDPDRAWMAANDYGERLEALLLGVSHHAPAGTESAGPVVRQVSRELLSDSRFYRRVADRRNDAALAGFLSRIEVILLALATAPEGEEQEVMDSLRDFIAESELLSELRNVRTSVPPLPRRRPTTTSGS